MKQLHGLENLAQSLRKPINASQLAQALLDDLRQCECVIYGCIDDNPLIELARLQLLPDTLNYEMFDQRIDLNVAGTILRDDCVPLTYRLSGQQFAISGRCSMIARVCGVDLYLHSSYTGVVGDLARQRFSLAVPALAKRINAF
ncbi:MAG: hypothetical protein EBR59_08045 [Methylococcaceae bacterium]|nr:hypothetical protein [Methylococcaceae bacterium]